ncbi:hypothetical protein GCM10007874_58820 [Labrys miyagiensis]|uniref:Uncharacterized protein n=1 Tax=Labrys miyagiensis TaxID=346912 RepID=A0ABQ6CRA4_9HYPH|nr:hypothetical protein [Labrys miyagiensis]GLS22862.1 hypothetical protein GCM10007874_58820 [Labrys miyagiensis]
MDIVERLRVLAVMVDDRPVTEIEDLLNEAADTIETLRSMIDQRQYVPLENAKPEGSA